MDSQHNDSETTLTGPAVQPGVRRVLIVEDEVAMNTVLNHVLYSLDQGLQPVWVSTAEDAIEALKHEKFELIISDHYLAGPRSGLYLWVMCRKRQPGIPFLFISAMAIQDFLKMTRGMAQAPSFLPKPFTTRAARESIAALLGMNERIQYVS